MPDYGEILSFLARNPPQFEAERRLHASLLELMAQCLRAGGDAAPAGEAPLARAGEAGLDTALAESHKAWVRFN